jgi:hypothetical protein
MEVGAMNRDSGRFDDSLLRQLGRFRKAFGPGLSSLIFEEHEGGVRSVLDPKTVESARELISEIPNPRRVRVKGTLDMVRFSTQSFGIKTADEQEVRGVLVEGDMELLKEFLNHEILVEGKAVYRPSGQVLRIDVEAFRSGKGEPDVWSEVPPPLSRKRSRSSFQVRQGPGSGVPAFFGTWPGDESEEELLQAIRGLDE